MSKVSIERVPKIVLTGTYCSLNRGDATMQIVCAEALRERLPGARITIHAPFPAIDGPFYDRRGLPVVASTRRRLIASTVRWARIALRKRLQGKLSDEMKVLTQADLVVDLSGDMLTEDYGLHVAYSHYLPLLQVLAAGVPLALCAQSVGPFQHSKLLARRIFKGASLVTLRETRSLDHLESLGIPPSKPKVTADLAFALKPASQALVDAALDQEGIALDAEPLIGVSFSSLVGKGPRSGASLGDCVARSLRKASDALGARVLLVPHVYGPKEAQDDRHALGTLYRTLRESLDGRVHLLQHEHEPEVLKGLIARCDIFLGARMHAVMGALSGAVPVFALAYSHKAHGIMGDFAMGEWVRDSLDVSEDDLTDGLMTLWDRRSEVSSVLSVKAAQARRKAEGNIDLLVELINGRERDR